MLDCSSATELEWQESTAPSVSRQQVLDPNSDEVWRTVCQNVRDSEIRQGVVFMLSAPGI